MMMKMLCSGACDTVWRLFPRLLLSVSLLLARLLPCRLCLALLSLPPLAGASIVCTSISATRAATPSQPLPPLLQLSLSLLPDEHSLLSRPRLFRLRLLPSLSSSGFNSARPLSLCSSLLSISPAVPLLSLFSLVLAVCSPLPLRVPHASLCVRTLPGSHLAVQTVLRQSHQLFFTFVLSLLCALPPGSRCSVLQLVIRSRLCSPRFQRAPHRTSSISSSGSFRPHSVAHFAPPALRCSLRPTAPTLLYLGAPMPRCDFASASVRACASLPDTALCPGDDRSSRQDCLESMFSSPETPLAFPTTKSNPTRCGSMLDTCQQAKCLRLPPVRPFRRRNLLWLARTCCAPLSMESPWEWLETSCCGFRRPHQRCQSWTEPAALMCTEMCDWTARVWLVFHLVQPPLLREEDCRSYRQSDRPSR